MSHRRLPPPPPAEVIRPAFAAGAAVHQNGGTAALNPEHDFDRGAAWALGWQWANGWRPERGALQLSDNFVVMWRMLGLTEAKAELWSNGERRWA